MSAPSGWSRTWEVRLFFGELYLPFKGKGLNRNEAKAAKGALLSGVAPELMGRGTEVLPCPQKSSTQYPNYLPPRASSSAVRHGDEGAHELLACVYEWFTEGFETPDLQEAKGLLEELTAA